MYMSRNLVLRTKLSIRKQKLVKKVIGAESSSRHLFPMTGQVFKTKSSFLKPRLVPEVSRQVLSTTYKCQFLPGKRAQSVLGDRFQLSF